MPEFLEHGFFWNFLYSRTHLLHFATKVRVLDSFWFVVGWAKKYFLAVTCEFVDFLDSFEIFSNVANILATGMIIFWLVGVKKGLSGFEETKYFCVYLRFYYLLPTTILTAEWSKFLALSRKTTNGHFGTSEVPFLIFIHFRSLPLMFFSSFGFLMVKKSWHVKISLLPSFHLEFFVSPIFENLTKTVLAFLYIIVGGLGAKKSKCQCK